MATELLTTPQRNARRRIDNPNASASNINIEGNLSPVQVSEVLGLGHANVGDDNFSLSNSVETSSSQCETSINNAFSILESNMQADQQLLESNSVDKNSSANPREDENNLQIDVNNNVNNNNIDVSHDRENNGVNLENPVSDADAHNNQDNNNNIPISVTNVVILLPERDPIFHETKRETEDSEEEVVNKSGINAKNAWLTKSDNLLEWK